MFGNHEKLNFEPNVYKKERSIYMYFDHEYKQNGINKVSAFMNMKIFVMDGISLTQFGFFSLKGIYGFKPDCR